MTDQASFQGPEAPSCVHCGQTNSMYLEEGTLMERRWHCRGCGHKTTKKTVLGIAMPIATVVGFLFGITFPRA